MDKAPRDALFAQCVASHMGILLKTAHGFAADAADRDDLVQEMLISVWEALPWFDERQCKLSTFMYRVANNRALNWHRSRRRYRDKLIGFQNHPQLTLDPGETESHASRLEWLYRLASEPRRLMKRYMVTNTLFILGFSKQLISRKILNR